MKTEKCSCGLLAEYNLKSISFDFEVCYLSPGFFLHDSVLPETPIKKVSAAVF